MYVSEITKTTLKTIKWKERARKMYLRVSIRATFVVFA